MSASSSFYKIVHDEQALKNFIDWLPDLEKEERYYVSLLSRSKYYGPEAKKMAFRDARHLVGFESTKEKLFEKIKRLECSLGSYTYETYETGKGNEMELSTKNIPQETLCLYIQPNPRNLIVASKTLVKRLVDLFTNNIFASDPTHSNEMDTFNPVSVALTEVCKASKRKIFVDFDFDNVTVDDTVKVLSQYINFDAIDIVKTKNGFHLLVQPQKVSPEFSKTWYHNISKMEGIDNVKDSDRMVPIPGCTQGGFIPRLLSEFHSSSTH